MKLVKFSKNSGSYRFRCLEDDTALLPEWDVIDIPNEKCTKDERICTGCDDCPFYVMAKLKDLKERITLLKELDWSYRKIGRELGIGHSHVKKIYKA